MAAILHLPGTVSPRMQRGVGLVETMVGIVIGMIVIVAIFNVFALAENYKRTTTGVADAQVTGQFAQFVMGRELANAGNGLMAGVDDLATCNNDWKLKPIPVLITDGGAPTLSDTVVVYYSNAIHVTNPVLFTANAVTPAVFTVQSPNGFRVNDYVIASDRVANCWLTRVTAIAQWGGGAYPPAGPQGQIDLTYVPAPAPALTFNSGSRLVNMGPNFARTQYTVDPAKRQLYSQDVNPIAGLAVQPVVPIAGNIVLMKAQYGLDTSPAAALNGTVDCWQAADNSNVCGVGDLTDTVLRAQTGAALATMMRRIVTVRIAMVVRSDEGLLRDDASNLPFKGQVQYLFNCSANTNVACPRRLLIDSTNNVLQDLYRYRIYETTIPLRNALWNFK
jgi:type IV pilus assembly protein PilW